MLGLSELLEQALLRSAYRRGHVDIDDDQNVAPPVTVHVGNTLAAEPQHLARLRTGLDLDLGPGVDRRHFDRSAEHGLRESYIQVVYQIVAIAHEFLVGFLLDQYEQIAVDPAVTCGIALAADGQLHALADAGRNPYLDDLLASDNPLAVTFRAGRRDDASLAVTSGTGLGSLRAAEKGIDHLSHITRSVAGRTRRIGALVLRSGTSALIASDHLVDL